MPCGIPAVRVSYDTQVMPRCLVYVLAVVLAASSAAADTVRLANGNRFENVIAEVTGDAVTIRFSYGDMVLPRALVAGVDKAGSTLATYLEAAARLDADPGVTAREWLQLALDTRASGLEDGYRRALLRAAELEPQWPGLAERLQALDYVWDAERGRWVPYAESRQAQAEAERHRAREVERTRVARDDSHRRLVDAVEMLALARLTEAASQPAAPQAAAGIPVVTYVGAPAFAGGVAWGWRPTPHNRETMHQLERRQPGSLLPVAPLPQPALPLSGPAPQSHRGGMLQPAGPARAGAERIAGHSEGAGGG
jgi:hypothetical protein